MAFYSLHEIAESFGLQGHGQEEIRKRLRKRQAEIHPDKHGGKFESSETESEYLRIGEAIEAMDSGTLHRSMISVDSIPGLVSAMKDVLEPQNQEDRDRRLSERLTTQIDRSLSRFRAPYAGPRFTVTGVTAALTALWVFPTSVEQNAALRHFIDPSSTVFLVGWLYGIALTGAAWLLASRQKAEQERLLAALRAEPYQNRLFSAFLEEIGATPDSLFRKDDFVNFIQRHSFRHELPPPFRLIRRVIDYETAQATADVVLARLESRSIIEQSAEWSLSVTYRITSRHQE